jgi:hypothetical protein
MQKVAEGFFSVRNVQDNQGNEWVQVTVPKGCGLDDAIEMFEFMENEIPKIARPMGEGRYWIRSAAINVSGSN